MRKRPVRDIGRRRVREADDVVRSEVQRNVGEASAPLPMLRFRTSPCRRELDARQIALWNRRDNHSRPGRRGGLHVAREETLRLHFAFWARSAAGAACRSWSCRTLVVEEDGCGDVRRLLTRPDGDTSCVRTDADPASAVSVMMVRTPARRRRSGTSSRAVVQFLAHQTVLPVVFERGHPRRARRATR